MEDSIIYERYRELACEVIKQTTINFIYDDNASENHFYDWCMECSYFDYLSLDREYFFIHAKNKRDKRMNDEKKGVTNAEKIE